MLQTTIIHLKGVSFKNDALPVIKDYKGLVASAISCQGIWRFDIPELLTLDASGGIDSVASWKDSVTLLSFKDGAAKAALIEKAKGGAVAAVPSGTSYIADDTIKINGTQPYSILVIAKPDSYATQQAIAGAPVGSGGNNIRVEALTAAGVTSMRNVRGAALPIVPVLDATAHVAFIAAFDGVNTKAINLFGDSIASSVSVPSFVGLSFGVGSSGLYPFAGEVDMVALFNKDVSQDAALLGHIKELARMRIASL